MTANTRLCAVTGANGFVGGCLRRRLQREGWRVVSWTRQPKPGTDDVGFQLGQDVDPGLFKGARVLVHCAYDFGPLRQADIIAVNVRGSQKLLEAARKAGVESIVVISSLSAFAGCRSLYGKAKLQIESLALSADAVVIRPGLVYGNDSGGMFGRLVRQVRGSRLLPVLWGGNQAQYLVHEEDLGNLLQGVLAGRVPAGTSPITVAHAQGWELRVYPGPDRRRAWEAGFLRARPLADSLGGIEIPGAGRRARRFSQRQPDQHGVSGSTSVV